MQVSGKDKGEGLFEYYADTFEFNNIRGGRQKAIEVPLEDVKGFLGTPDGASIDWILIHDQGIQVLEMINDPDSQVGRAAEYQVTNINISRSGDTVIFSLEPWNCDSNVDRMKEYAEKTVSEALGLVNASDIVEMLKKMAEVLGLPVITANQPSFRVNSVDFLAIATGVKKFFTRPIERGSDEHQRILGKTVRLTNAQGAYVDVKVTHIEPDIHGREAWVSIELIGKGA